jgi:cysteine desulfurase
MIYLDNNATTAVAPEVFEAMTPYLTSLFGNPSSAHALGRKMKEAVEEARGEVATLIGAAKTSEIIFTSCGSESDNWAIRGILANHPDKKHIVTTMVEHEAVRNLCHALEQEGYEVSWIGVDQNGELDLDGLRNALREDTALVSVMLANNETGVLFPIEEIGKTVREKCGALFHVDGVQAVAKVPIDLKSSEVDLFALSGHKFHAPQGIGALYVRDGLELPPFIVGGKQELGRRAGTSAVPSIVGLGAAAKLARLDDDHSRIEQLRNQLEDEILSSIPNSHLNGIADRSKRLPNTSNISFEHVDGQSILAHLDHAGICVSTGSACHSSSHVSSPTLKAMNVPYSIAQGSIRFSVGRYNTDEEIETTLRVLPDIVGKLLEMSPSFERSSAALR